ncbi:hypothetical protein LQZ24_06185 [Fructobacillus sp. M1-13]|uniref:Phage protein n=1 Tax=Fructobacillus papyriferae TaxID=2713171 RepID=A0ABS5QP46_9LACO|nr:hypothetical protein [Fructobacillus papyriferae]MBS9334930.1 hypothetical protein [Fructobacillus papyriferae]MCD2159586.1 hypothetical protein [Fructobacillus papyriferae]
MLIIEKITVQELKAIGQAETIAYDDLAIPETEYGSKKDLVQAVIEAYDLGELTTLSHISSPHVLKAAIEKSGHDYQLQAKIRQE